MQPSLQIEEVIWSVTEASIVTTGWSSSLVLINELPLPVSLYHRARLKVSMPSMKRLLY